MNQLYFGDNLDILKDLHRKHPEGYIDLIYIDPPFNSKRNYNILFEDIEMKDTKAQKEAFADTWSNVSYIDTLNEIKELDLDLFSFINALDQIRISKGAISYLTTMAIRIWYMHKILKESGSFYLHCDPTMSHYLKLICDLVFGENNFRNEIIWKRTSARSDSKRWNQIHDVIFLFSKSNKYTWNPQFKEYSQDYIEKFYRYIEEDTGRRFTSSDLTAAGTRNGSSGMNWRGIDVRSKGLHWKFTIEKLDELDKEGRILWPKKQGGMPRYKRYLDEMKGIAIQSIIDDIAPIQAHADEKLGYPTQKPVTLLERIVKASSNDRDIIADFFCGCGTTIAAAEKLNRKWIGSDISHLAIKLISKRLIDTYGPKVRETYEIFGFPRDIASARELGNQTRRGRFKFEEWIVEVMLHGVLNQKKTETGFDGYFTMDIQGKHKDVVLIEVKSGGATLTQLNHFIRTVEKKDADAGIFVCFTEQVTRGMKETAKKAGYYRPELYHTRNQYERIQIITVEDLLDDKLPNLPSFRQSTFKAAKIQEKGTSNQKKLFE